MNSEYSETPHRSTMGRAEFLNFVKNLGFVGLISSLFDGTLPKHRKETTYDETREHLCSIIESEQVTIRETLPKLLALASKQIEHITDHNKKHSTNEQITIPEYLNTPDEIAAYMLLRALYDVETQSIMTLENYKTANTVEKSYNENVGLLSHRNTNLYTWFDKNLLDNQSLVELITQAIESRDAQILLRASLSLEALQPDPRYTPLVQMVPSMIETLQSEGLLPIQHYKANRHPSGERGRRTDSSSDVAGMERLSDIKSRLQDFGGISTVEKRKLTSKEAEKAARDSGKFVDMRSVYPDIKILDDQSLVQTTLVQKLTNLHTKLKDLKHNPIDLALTTCWPPRLIHGRRCHYTGTCVDADISGKNNPSSEDVVAFIKAAQECGLYAVYETADESQASKMRVACRGRVPLDRIQYISHATGIHFSLYNILDQTDVVNAAGSNGSETSVQ